jgi:peptide chain release factor 1
MTHVPTGITVVSQCRKRTQSYEEAWTELERRVRERSQIASLAETSVMRKEQVGSGMRADKVRTYRFQDDQVKDHQTGKTAKVSQVMRGRFDLLR